MPFIDRPTPLPQTRQPIVAAQGDEEHERDEPEPAEEPIRTQMVGETPEDDLGYDPDLIPTEPIEDDD